VIFESLYLSNKIILKYSIYLIKNNIKIDDDDEKLMTMIIDAYILNIFIRTFKAHE